MNPDQFTAARRTLTDRLVQFLKQLFLQPGSWRDDELAVFVQQAVPLVEAAQRQLAIWTALNIAYDASAALGRAIAPIGIPDSAAVNLRRGVDTEDVYERPFRTVYAALAKGKSLPDAVLLGENRIREVVELDLQQTYAEASRSAMEQLPDDAQPRFWRRELRGEENCALCVLASTQRYHIEKLNPIHPGCDCRVKPIWGKTDPGQVIDEELLGRAHDAVQELTGQADAGGREPDYRKIVLQMTREHGEVGPMLARPLDHFTTEAAL